MLIQLLITIEQVRCTISDICHFCHIIVYMSAALDFFPFFREEN